MSEPTFNLNNVVFEMATIVGSSIYYTCMVTGKLLRVDEFDRDKYRCNVVYK